MPVLNDFWAAFADGDEGRLRGLLHDDVAFASPAFAEPTRGADVVARVLLTAHGIYTEPAATQTLDDGAGGGAVFFAAEVAGERIQGVYRLDADGDRIARIDALFRPVGAAAELVRQMMLRLAAKAES